MRPVSMVVVGAVALGAVGAAFGCGAFSGSDTPVVGEAGTSGEDAGTTTDGAPDGEAGAAPEAAVPEASTDPGVFCGGKYCNPQTEVCCTAPAVGNPICMLQGGAGPVSCPSSTLGCDDGADCSHVTNGVCCGDLASDNVHLASSACYALADCKKTTFWVVVCDPNAPTPCPGGVACTIPAGGGYGFCAGLAYNK